MIPHRVLLFVALLAVASGCWQVRDHVTIPPDDDAGAPASDGQSIGQPPSLPDAAPTAPSPDAAGVIDTAPLPPRVDVAPPPPPDAAAPRPDAPVAPPAPPPDAGPNCTNACTPGRQQCAEGGGIADCVMLPSGCLGWGPAARCPSPQSCQKSGESGATCECAAGGCTSEGDQRCGQGNHGIQTCTKRGVCLDWSAEQGCPSPTISCQVTSGTTASCMCPSPALCLSGASRCGPSGELQECVVSNGCPDWSDEQRCPGQQTCALFYGAGTCQDPTTVLLEISPNPGLDSSGLHLKPLDFGTVAVGSSSTISFRVENRGPAVAQMPTINVADLANRPSPFTLDANSCPGSSSSPARLLVGETCTGVLRYLPKATGAQSAALQIFTQAFTSVVLTGTGK